MVETSSGFPALAYPWQSNTMRQLEQQIEEDRLPHALMLTGPPGVGKRHLARVLAQRLLCRAPRAGSACGKCHACGLLRAGTHPDFHRIAPEEPGKAIKIDAVRELTRRLVGHAQQSGYKLVTLEPAEAMNANAANALLKTLEEPAENTLLILVSDNPASVLPTIRSRCQLCPLPMPPRDRVLPWLSPLVSSSDITPDRLLDLARGAPLKALALLQGDALEQLQQMERDFIALCEQRLTAMALADQWQKGDLTVFLEWLLNWIYDLTRWQQGLELAGFSALPETLQSRLRRLPPALLHRYLAKLLRVKQQWLSGANPNKQLLLEELLLDWGALLRQGSRAA